MTWQDYIQPALDRQRAYRMEDVEQMLAEGVAQLWKCETGAAITQIIQHPREKWMTIWLTGGNMEDLFAEVLPDIEAMAKAEGCNRMLLGGRKGWVRALRSKGYAETDVICEKVIP